MNVLCLLISTQLKAEKMPCLFFLKLVCKLLSSECNRCKTNEMAALECYKDATEEKMDLKIIAYWGLAPCSIIEVDRSFRGV
jgi:hypothetical protein